MIIEYLVGSVIGAVTGGFTNHIAIRMLFKPHKEKYIMGFHIPFTPGIIPKRRDRLAESIGKSVSEDLMNREVLEKSLLSKDMLDKISSAIDEFVSSQQKNDETIEQFAKHYLTNEDIDAMRENVTTGIVKMMTTKLQDSRLGESIAHMATEHVMEKTRNSVAGILGADMLLQPIAPLVERILAKHINEILQNNSQQMVEGLVINESEQLMNMTMKQLTTDRDEQVAQIKRGILNAYHVIITDHLPRILQDIDISGIIKQRINEMNMEEVEDVINRVIKNELQALVWVGAFIGAILGIFNPPLNNLIKKFLDLFT